MNRFINLEITALETDGKGKMISNPRVVTSNNVRAIIEQGTEIPYKETSALGATNTSFRKASLKLEVTPQISNSGEVTLDVDVTKDSVGVQTTEGYAINTKHVQTQVKIDNGGTLVIGGIYQEDNRNSVDKVPFLGDLPLLGHLFKTTTRATSKTELLIFLTPHILDSRGNILPTNVEKLNIDE
jgi:type IV pilus assembly protein PilQ